MKWITLEVGFAESLPEAAYLLGPWARTKVQVIGRVRMHLLVTERGERVKGGGTARWYPDGAKCGKK